MEGLTCLANKREQIVRAMREFNIMSLKLPWDELAKEMLIDLVDEGEVPK
jgi:hypothetical protein